jgi:hypothetical protein
LRVCFHIAEIKKKAFTKAHQFKEMWEDDRKKMLWENKHKNAIDKVIDKNPSNAYIELKMSYYKQMI